MGRGKSHHQYAAQGSLCASQENAEIFICSPRSPRYPSLRLPTRKESTVLMPTTSSNEKLQPAVGPMGTERGNMGAWPKQAIECVETEQSGHAWQVPVQMPNGTFADHLGRLRCRRRRSFLLQSKSRPGNIGFQNLSAERRWKWRDDDDDDNVVGGGRTCT